TASRTNMRRRVEPELLDELPPNDPHAIQSRRDLQRVNAFMGNPRIMARALQSAFSPRIPHRLVELGAGDGTFLLQVARGLPPDWRGVHVTLVDRHNLLRPETVSAFASMDWRVEAVTMDIFDWLGKSVARDFDAIVANLFLHHFSDVPLGELLRATARHTQVFAAIDPRRALFPLALSHLLWAIGCNQVTRHDAVI